MRRLIPMFVVAISVVNLFMRAVYAEDGYKISFMFIEISPTPELQERVPFDIIFRLKNTGDLWINPYAEVTVSGEIFDLDAKNKPFKAKVKFKSLNAGSKVPFAEGIITGHIDESGEPVARILDKTYRLYNFWPGDQSGRLRARIRALPKGKYNIKLYINAFSKVHKKNLSTETYEMKAYVK